MIFTLFIQSVQFSSVTQSCLTPWIAACQASVSITNSRSLLKLMSIKSVMPSSHLILCHPLLLLPLIPPSIRVFFNESTLWIRWPKYWSFSFNISPSNEHPRLISFRMYWLDLLAVQGTLKSLLQHHSSKALIFWHSAFLIVQLSHPYMTTGKTIALTRWTFVGKVMYLKFLWVSAGWCTYMHTYIHIYCYTYICVYIECAYTQMIFKFYTFKFVSICMCGLLRILNLVAYKQDISAFSSYSIKSPFSLPCWYTRQIP